MEEGSISGTGSEKDEMECETSVVYLEFGGIKIPSSRLIKLMETVQHKKTLELDSLGEDYRKKRKHKRKKKKKSKKVAGSGGVRMVEEVSESASEIRSTTCTSTTATECRDSRRPNLPKLDSMFNDPELDDNGGFSLSNMTTSAARHRKAPPPNQKKEKQLARLDKITADEFRRKQRWNNTRRGLVSDLNPLLSSPPPLSSPSLAFNNHSHETRTNSETASTEVLPSPVISDQRGGGGDSHKGSLDEVDEEGVTNENNVSFTFDDEDSEASPTSESDMKISLLSQINKVEELLDSEGLS